MIFAARYVWRQLTSMRTALLLLLLLGIAAIPGSLIPQRTSAPMQVQEYFSKNPSRAKLYDQLSLFDVYGSPWFSAIYILLFISLIGCVIPRTIEHAKSALAKPPVTPSRLDRMSFYQDFVGSIDKAESILKSAKFRIRRETNSISAEKGYLRETGNLLFHLSLILILLGISFSSLFGVRGDAIVNIGERFTNTPTSYDSINYGKLTTPSDLPPFLIKPTNFVAKYNPKTNQPTDYTLTVLTAPSPTGEAVKKIIKVNKPLKYGDTSIYLQANGYSPIVTVRDANEKIVLQGPIPFLPQDGNLASNGAIKVPDMNPQLGFVAQFFPTFEQAKGQPARSTYPEALDPRLFVAAWRGDLGLDNGIPQSIYKIDTKKLFQIGLKSMKVGQTFSFKEGSITFEGYVPWVNLQIVKDPGKSLALIGALLAILGLLASLFARQRRIWIREVSKNKLEIAGLAKNAAPGLSDEINELVRKINE
jgi:cytochrome c biogenesis protein